MSASPRLGFLGVWFFLTLAPTSSILPIATEVGAERRMYLPLMALVALAVVGLSRRATSGPAAEHWRSPPSRCSRAGTVATNVRIRSRACDWRETTLERWPTPACALDARNGTGRRRTARRSRDATCAKPRRSIRRRGTTSARCCAAQGQQPEAIEQFRAFIASQPPELDQVAHRAAACSPTR